MDLPGASYLLGLGEIAMTFVGFSSVIMVFRQTAGGRLSRLDSWITLIFVQLGFIVMAGALAPSVLSLCGWPPIVVWRACSAVVAVLISAFSISYPARRHAVSGVATPTYVWIDLALLAGCVIILIADAAGWPWTPGAGAYVVGLTGIMGVSALGYLNALGALHQQTPGPPGA
jgi:hypothetical protein